MVLQLGLTGGSFFRSTISENCSGRLFFVSVIASLRRRQGKLLSRMCVKNNEQNRLHQGFTLLLPVFFFSVANCSFLCVEHERRLRRQSETSCFEPLKITAPS